MKSALLIALVFCQIATFHCLPAKPLISDGFTAPEEVSSFLRRMNAKPSIYLSVSKLREGNTVECSFDDVKNLISQTLGNSGCQVVNDYSAANLELKVCISLFRTVKARPKFTSYLDFRFTFVSTPTGKEYFKAISIAGEADSDPLAQKAAWSKALSYIFLGEEFKACLSESPVSTSAVAATIAHPPVMEDPLKPFCDVDMDIPAGKSPKPDAFAVVFCIENYKSMPGVLYANRDGYYMKEYLSRSLGIPPQNIYYRENDSVTKAEFDKVFAEGGWLSKRILSGKSELYVYYAGHGAPSLKDEKPYLIPYDGDINYPHLTGVSLETLMDNISALNAKNSLLLLDACFTGMNRENQALLADARPIAMEVKLPALTKGVNVVSATAPKQISSGFSDKKHGLFTYYLLKSLRGEADINGDRKMSLSELHSYIRANVSRAANQIDREQEPQLQSLNPEQVIIDLP